MKLHSLLYFKQWGEKSFKTKNNVTDSECDVTSACGEYIYYQAHKVRNREEEETK